MRIDDIDPGGSRFPSISRAGRPGRRDIPRGGHADGAPFAGTVRDSSVWGSPAPRPVPRTITDAVIITSTQSGEVTEMPKTSGEETGAGSTFFSLPAA